MQVLGASSEGLVVLPAAGGYRLHGSKCWKYSESKLFLSSTPTIAKSYPSIRHRKLATTWLDKYRLRDFTVRASANPLEEDLPSIAPVHLESPAGQFLTQVVQTHPHLFPSAVDQQLEVLTNERDAPMKESSSSSQDMSLYRRIAEVKEKERRKAVEEIMYCLVVHKFMEKEIILIPKLSSTPSSDPTGRVDFWPNQELKLESVHSPEAFELIQSHLSLVLEDRMVGALQSFVEMSKIKLGKLYAASVMYGYFLKRVDQRFQLEGTVKKLPPIETREREVEEQREAEAESDYDMSEPSDAMWGRSLPVGGAPSNYMGEMMMDPDSKPSSRLRSYVMYLDPETLQRLATIRSGEAMSLIERQTQSLFGRPEIRVSDDGALQTTNDETLVLSVPGLAMLVLEAVAFGTFLWDAEDYVDSKYQITKTKSDT